MKFMAFFLLKLYKIIKNYIKIYDNLIDVVLFNINTLILEENLMENLSIVLKVNGDKIDFYITKIEPLLEDGKTQLNIICNNYNKINCNYEYKVYSYSQEYRNFKEFAISTCKNDNIIILEDGITLNDLIINSLKEELVKEERNDIKYKHKIYLDKTDSNYTICEETILYRRGSNRNIVLDIVVEDSSLIDMENLDIQRAVYRLLTKGKYEELLDYYKNVILKLDEGVHINFVEKLEKEKIFNKEINSEIIEDIFINSKIENNYINYLKLLRCYKLENSINFQLLNIIKLQEKEVHFSYFILEVFKNKLGLMDLFNSLDKKIINIYMDYLCKNIKDFYEDVYNFIISVDLEKELSILNNSNVDIYMNIIKNYIKNMADSSEDLEKKQKLIQMFTDYINIGLYKIHQYKMTNQKIVLTPENRFLDKVSKAIGYINQNNIKEASQVLRQASSEYKLIERPVEYYIQKLIFENKTFPYKLSICMIAKDEEKNIDRCLASMKPLLDSGIAELVFVDTGSSDKTIEIAEKYVDKIYIHPWQGSFSEARNYSISLAQGEYIFILDADEEMEIKDINKVINEFNNDDYKSYNTFSFKIKNFSDEKLKKFSIMSQNLIFKNDGTFYYQGTVHNQPIFKGPIRNLDATILHYGYIMTEDIKDRKFNRTATLLKKELEKNPNNLYYRFQLSVSYSMHGDQKEALEQVEIYMKYVDENWEHIKNGFNLMYFNNAALVYMNNELYDKAIEICNRGLEITEDFIDFIYYKALAFFNKKQYESCVEDSIRYLNLLSEFNEHEIINDNRYLFYSLDSEDITKRMLAISYHELERYSECIESALNIKDDSILENTLFILLKAYFKTFKFNELAEFYKDKILNNNRDGIKDIFTYFMEENLLDINKDQQDKCIVAFAKSDIDDNYVDILRFRAGSNIEQDPHRVLKFIDKYNIEEADEKSAEMIFNTLWPIVKQYNDNYNLNDIELKNLKRSLRFILNRSLNLRQFSMLTKEELLSIFNLYVELCNLLNNKYLLDSEEQVFINSMLKAFEEVKANNLINALTNIKDAVSKHREMAKPVELFLETIIPGYEAKVDYINDNGEEKMSDELIEYSKKVKSQIEELINNNLLEEAKVVIKKYEEIIKKDTAIYSMKAIILIMESKLDEAKNILIEGLNTNSENFDLNYNLAYIYEQKEDYKYAFKYYNKALELCNNGFVKEEINNTLENIKIKESNVLKEKKKIVFFDKGDDKFIWDIINELSKEYETKKVTVRNLKQIDEWMQWADICWFEWCDELIGYGSKLPLAKEKKVICRLHRYEALTEYPKNVQWENVDKLIIVTKHLKNFLVAQIPDIEDKVNIITINNGVNLGKYKLKQRTSGFNVAYVGYIHSRKNPSLLLQIINKIVKIDNRYKLYVAGQFQDGLIQLYWNHQIKQMGLQNNIIFQGWQDDMSKWLEDKNYILSTTIHESFGYGIAEAMARGIKPIIHNFIFAEEIWDDKYLFNDIDEAAKMITSKEYNSKEYRKFIEDNYSLEKQLIKIKNAIELLEFSKENKVFSFNYDGNNIKFYLPYLNDWVQKVIYQTNNFYEISMLQDIKNRLGADKVIIDVGANIGNHTVFFSKVCRAKKVYSFEPQLNIFNVLKKNVVLNEVDNIVQIYNMGLGKEHTSANITVLDENNYGMSKLNKVKNGEIEINSLDNILIDKVTTIDMIKIDVEGMELEVLEGAKNILIKFKPIIYIEAGTDEEFKNVLKFLECFNYKAIYRFNATPTYLFIHNK